MKNKETITTDSNRTTVFLLLGFIYTTSIFSTGAFFTYFIGYLYNELGIATTITGAMASASSLLGVVAVPTWGYATDKIRSPKLIIMILLFGSIVATVGLMIYESIIAIFIFYLIFMLFRNPLMSQLDNIGTKLAEFHDINFGSIKKFGSLGYLLGSLITGFIMTSTDRPDLFYNITIITTFISMFFVLFLPRVGEATHEKISLKEAAKIFQDKEFLKIALVYAVIFGCESTSNQYMPVLYDSIGGNSSNVGINTLVMVIPELIFLGIFVSYMNKYGCKKILLAASVAAIIRFIGLMFATSPIQAYMFTWLHGIVASAFLPVMSYYIIRHVDKSYTSTAFSLAFAISSIFSGIIALTYGFIIEEFGVKFIYVETIILTILGILVALTIKEDKDHKKSNYKM